jgi:hypothetical protein
MLASLHGRLSPPHGTQRQWTCCVFAGGVAIDEGDKVMCDYSLEHVMSRPAAVTDRLIVTNFHHTITRGFASAGDLDTAVCLRPGTEIAFDREARFEHPITHWQKAAPGQVARFRQVELETPHAHHDALEFADGTIVKLAWLLPGQWATVLQLPTLEKPVSAVSSAPRATAAPDGETLERRPADSVV